MEINITVQIDPGSTLSFGRHFLSIPTYIMYEQRMAGGASNKSVGSVMSVTVNFTVRESKWSGLAYVLLEYCIEYSIATAQTNFRFMVQTKYRLEETNFHFVQTKYRLEQTKARAKFRLG